MTRVAAMAAARGGVVLIAAGGLVAVATATDARLHLDRGVGTPTVSRVALEATRLVCPGGELAGLEGVTSIATTGTVVTATPPAELIRELVDLPRGRGALTIGALAEEAATGAVGVASATVTEPEAVFVDATGGRAPGLVAAQETRIVDPLASGRLEVACTVPRADAWLIGGGSAPGRQERILLANGGENPVTVDLEILGRDGVVPTPSGVGVVVPALGRVAVLLDAIAGPEESPVVHVTARDGFVHATLTDTWLDGTAPRGVDDIGPASAPAELQVVPGVTAGHPALVRIAATADREALVQVRLITRDGRVPLPGGTGVRRVPPRGVLDIAIEALPRGVLAVEVSADAPVVAAVMSFVLEDGERTDFAWSPATSAVRGLAGAAYGPLGTTGTRTLSLVATGGAAHARVAVVDKGIATYRDIVLAAHVATTVTLRGQSVWVLAGKGEGSLHAAVVSRVAGTITARPLTAARLSTQEVPVVAR